MKVKQICSWWQVAIEKFAKIRNFSPIFLLQPLMGNPSKYAIRDGYCRHTEKVYNRTIYISIIRIFVYYRTIYNMPLRYAFNEIIIRIISYGNRQVGFKTSTAPLPLNPWEIRLALWTFSPPRPVKNSLGLEASQRGRYRQTRPISNEIA